MLKNISAITARRVRDEHDLVHKAALLFQDRHSFCINAIHDALRDLLETEPDIQTFDVHTSLGHNIAGQKAA